MGRLTYLYKPESSPSRTDDSPCGRAYHLRRPVSTKIESGGDGGWRGRLRRLVGGRPHDVETPSSSSELAAIAAIARALTRARDLETAARPLVEQVQILLGVEFAAVTVVDPDRTEATGVLARLDDADADWWRDLRLDLRNEP